MLKRKGIKMESSFNKKGRLIGAILLIAGCCIGAGMLGLPVLSAKAGFIPSLALFFICWLYMAVTGILLLEINLWSSKETHIVSMASKTLGPIGKAVSWLLFLFLFYSLMVAYIAASGSLTSEFLQGYGYSFLPQEIGHFLFCLLFGLLIYLGTAAIDWFNRFLMIGLMITYLGLVAVGLPHIEKELLQHRDWSAATFVIPALIVSFGFHNLVPSVTTYLNRDAKKVIFAILIGSAIPLFIYLVWELLILGLVPLQQFEGALSQGSIATEALKQAGRAPWVTMFAELFAFFAIVTSLLSVALSFTDFLADALQIKKTAQGKVVLVMLVLVPPLFFALLYPNLFLVALNYAGGFGAVILFGILPVLMTWKGRYHQRLGHPQLLPGGKFALGLIFLFALSVVGLQLVNRL